MRLHTLCTVGVIGVSYACNRTFTLKSRSHTECGLLRKYPAPAYYLPPSLDCFGSTQKVTDTATPPSCRHDWGGKERW
jgi:hypothetical protein